MKLLNRNGVADTMILDYFLRFSIAIGFMSAVLDRFGFWPKEVSSWGNWSSFVEYTGVLNPWFPAIFIPIVAILATAAEIVFALCLMVGYKKELVARASGGLLLIFALAMAVNTGVKGVLDYSVLIAAAAAFSLSILHKKEEG